MKGEPGLATGLTTLGALLPFIRPVPKLVSREDRTGARAPSASYCSTEGVAPLHIEKFTFGKVFNYGMI